MTVSTPMHARVEVHNNRPTLLVNDAPTLPLIYALTDCPGGRWSWEDWPRRNLEQFAQQGVTLFQLDVWLDQVFDESGALDVEFVRRDLRGVLEVCPQAGIFVRLHVNASLAWNHAHRDECCAYADCEPNPNERWGLRRPLDDDEANPLRASLASTLWRDDATRKLERFCREVAETPEGAHLIGIQPACGVFGEWHQWGFIAHEPDVSAPMLRFFRDWLREKYRDDASLQSAWNDASATLETATFPDLQARHEVRDGLFRDPQTQRAIMDYFECQQKVVADDIIHFCRVAKENWPRELVTGAFYGYFFTMFGRHASGGHLQMERVLRSPHVDYLSAPLAYAGHTREIGGSGQSRGLVTACARGGKLWLDEWDQNTHLHDGALYRTLETDLHDDLAIVRRFVMQAYARGGGGWFYDFGPRYVSGWWDHPDLLRDIRQLRELLGAKYQEPFSRDADVLVVYDTNVFYTTGHSYDTDVVSHIATDELSSALYRSGVVFDEILLFQLPHIDLERYRAVVFANTFQLSDEQRDFIRERVATNGQHLLWNYAPGYSNGARLDLAFVEELCGMSLRRVTPNEKPVAIIDAPDFPPSRAELWHSVPLFAVDDARAIALGHLENTSHVIFARLELSDTTSWFSSLPLRDADAFRRVFELAGAHVYSDAGDALHAGGGVLCLHTKSGGPRRVTLKSGQVLNLELPPRSTTLFDTQSGERLM